MQKDTTATPADIAEWAFGPVRPSYTALASRIYAYAEKRVEEFRAEMEQRIARILK